MKHVYSKEELEELKAIEEGEFRPVSDEVFEKESLRLKQAAHNTIEKQKRKKSYNIRLFEDDVMKIKAFAMREGLPYQTYLSSLIHKIATGEIKPV